MKNHCDEIFAPMQIVGWGEPANPNVNLGTGVVGVRGLTPTFDDNDGNCAYREHQQ